MKKLLFFAAFAAFVACAKLALEQTETPGNSDMPEQVETKEVTIYATATDTKTQLDGDNVKWSVGDEIKVCFAPGSTMDMYRDRYGTTFDFTLSNLDESAETALFKGSYSSSTDRGNVGLAFYPNDNDLFSYQSLRPKMMSNITYTISYDIPSEQQIVEDGSFAPNINPSWAPILTKDMDNNVASVAFRNLCALIKINMPQEDYNVKKILIESANTARGCLSGNVSLTWNSSNQSLTTPAGYQYPSDNTTVTLTKADGTNLTPGASYYAVVWPIDHAGLKFTFTDADGNEAVKQTPSGKNYTFNAGQYHTFNISSLSFDVAPYLTVDVSSLTPRASGTSGSFIVAANNSWTAVSSDNSWLTVTEETGMLSYTVKANTEPVSRTATITITSADITKTVTVTQPPVYYRSSTGSPISTAASLEDGALYMIYFATGSSNNQIDSYCWKSDYTNGDVSAYQFSDKTANATCDLVFKYHKTSSITDSWMSDGQSYLSAASGYLQSMYNGKYLVAGGSTILDFAAESTSGAVNLIFANQWSTDSVYGSDIDVYNYDSKSNTIYWNGGTSRASNYALRWTDYMGNTPRKWFFVKVTEVM